MAHAILLFLLRPTISQGRQSRMAKQGLDAVYRRNRCDGSKCNLRPGEANRLSVAEVEDYVFGYEVDVQADDAAPPQGRQAS